MLLSPRQNGLDSLFKEVRVFKVCMHPNQRKLLAFALGLCGLLAPPLAQVGVDAPLGFDFGEVCEVPAICCVAGTHTLDPCLTT